MNRIEASLDDAVPLLTLDPNDHMRSARELVGRLYTTGTDRTLHRYRGEFWQWDINHYRSAEDEMIRSTIWSFLDRANKMMKDGPVPFKPTKTIVANVFDALSAICQLNKFIEPPEWLNGDGTHPATEYMAVSNGLLHLTTGELVPPTPTFFGLNASTVAFNPRAPRPTEWIKFLEQVLVEPTAIETLQDWFGYTLSADTSQEKILLCIGPKRSGKGTAARVQTALLGKQSVAGPTMGALSQQFGLESLLAKPLAIIPDARIGQRTDRSMIVERLLSISGEDTIDVARKFKTAWSGRLPTRIAILTNEMLSLTDGSGALVGRFIVLLFQKSFYGCEDVGLTDKLLSELPGILNWAIEGYNNLCKRRHFIQPTNAIETIDAMETLGAPIKAFIHDQCEIGPTHTILVEQLYDGYRNWCVEQRLEPKSKPWFGRDLQTAVPGLSVNKVGTGTDQKKQYNGIGFPF